MAYVETACLCECVCALDVSAYLYCAVPNQTLRNPFVDQPKTNKSREKPKNIFLVSLRAYAQLTMDMDVRNGVCACRDMRQTI